MSGAEAAFFLIAAITVASGAGVVLSKNVVHAALFLIGTLLGVAGVFLLLSVEFLALVQVLIYAGAVTILLLFALMLSRVRDEPAGMVGGQWPLGFIVAAIFLGVFGFAVFETRWPGNTEELTAVPFETIGEVLFRNWAVPFEVASLVLLVALVGAIVLGRQEEGE